MEKTAWGHGVCVCVSVHMCIVGPLCGVIPRAPGQAPWPWISPIVIAIIIINCSERHVRFTIVVFSKCTHGFVVLSTFTLLCSNHHYHLQNAFHLAKLKLWTHWTKTPSPPSPLPLLWFSSLWLWLLKVTPVSEITQHLSFRDWLSHFPSFFERTPCAPHPTIRNLLVKRGNTPGKKAHHAGLVLSLSLSL